MLYLVDAVQYVDANQYNTEGDAPDIGRSHRKTDQCFLLRNNKTQPIQFVIKRQDRLVTV